MGLINGFNQDKNFHITLNKTEFLENGLQRKQRFYSFKIRKPIIDEFMNFFNDLENVEVQFEDGCW